MIVNLRPKFFRFLEERFNLIFDEGRPFERPDRRTDRVASLSRHCCLFCVRRPYCRRGVALDARRLWARLSTPPSLLQGLEVARGDLIRFLQRPPRGGFNSKVILKQAQATNPHLRMLDVKNRHPFIQISLHIINVYTRKIVERIEICII